MKIMLTNDDGVVSEGIRIMSRMLSEKEILGAVIAPDRERSGTGHAITTDIPVRLNPLAPGFFAADVSAYSCSGTPTDCVSIGLDYLFPHIDFVVSGINQGANMGDDVTYSGTVCAAMEAAILGRQAIAVSLVCDDKAATRYNTTAAIVTMAVIEHLKAHPLPAYTYLNINVPNVLVPVIKGFKITRLGVRRYMDKFVKLKDPKGHDCYWLGGTIREELEEGTDVAAVAEGYVSITPLHLDNTHRTFAHEMTDAGVAGTLFEAIHGGARPVA